MREWLFGLLLSLVIAGIVLGTFAVAKLFDMQHSAASCAGLYSLAASRADSLDIARDGCAAYLGKEGTE